MDIPETVCLTSLVSNTVIVSLPNTSLPVRIPHHDKTQEVDPPLRTIPTKKTAPPSASAPGMPRKFRGMSVAQLGKLNEEDQTDYLLYLTEKEAFANERQVEDEDMELQAALEASMREEPLNLVEPSKGTTETDTSKKCTTPARKRSCELLGGGWGWMDESDSKGDSKDKSKLDRALNYLETKEIKLTLTKQGAKKGKRKVGERNVVKVKNNGDPWKDWSTVKRSTSREDTELEQALKISRQEFEWTQLEDTFNDKVRGDKENNNTEEMTKTISKPCQPEHTYQLSSVVSHFGASRSSGHYVADVFRFDGGGWHRYDDSMVTKIDSRSVR